MLANRIRKNVKRLRKWRKRDAVSCYRVYDRDIPEIPLAVDVYDEHLHVARYARREPPPREWLDAMVAAAAEALEVDAGRVFVKVRERQRGRQQYERVTESGVEIEVVEDGLRFVVNLSDYLDTGLFLDHRETRKLVRAEAWDKRFLNLFAYTGTFSVYAAAGGARSTTTVDMSNTYLAWAERNLALNGFDRPEHDVVRADVLAWLAQPGERFDLVVVDPPSFSNSKKMQETFDVQRDHRALLEAVARRVTPGGVIWFSNNRRGFKLDEGVLDGAEIEEVTRRTVPPDFERSKPHQCWKITLPA